MTTATWERVDRAIEANRCKCPLAPGMTATQLLSLGGGCTMPGHCCPALDAYRRAVPRTPEADFA